MKLARLVVYLILSLYSISLFAQDNKTTQQQLDSLMAPHETYFTDPPEYWHDPWKYGVDPSRLKKILEANPNLVGWHVYYSRIAHIKLLQENKERDSAIYYALKSIKAFENLKRTREVDWKQEMMVYYLKGSAERNYGKNYEASLKSLQEAVRLAKENNLKNWEGICYYGIARNHSNMGNDSIAISYFLKTAADSLHMTNPRAYIATHLALSSLYRNSKQNELAKSYCQKAITVSLNSDYKFNLYPSYTIMADIYMNEKKEDSMAYYYKKAIDRYETVEINNPKALSGWKDRDIIYKAYFKIKSGMINEGIKDLNRIIKVITSRDQININDKEMAAIASIHLANAYEKQGESKKYTELLETTTAFFDKFQKQKLEEGLENLEIQYQTREKDLSITQLEQSKKQQQAIISQQRIITYGIGGLFLLLSGITVLFWRQRKLKNLYEKESLEQQLLRAQMNPHFTFNTLSKIQNMIDKNPKEAKNYLIRFSKLLVSVFESSTSNYVSLEKELKSLAEYIELQRIQFPGTFDYSIELNDIDAEMIFVPGMLLQPVVENSIKHGFVGIDHQGKISLEFTKEKSFLSCSIEDNGRGLNTKNFSKDGTSSTQLISNFLNKVTKRKYTILDKKDTFGGRTGVIVNFSIPYKLSMND